MDTTLSVVISWNRSGDQVISSDRILVSNATEVSAFTYRSELQIDILSQSVDNGDYRCDVTISSSPPLQYVQDATSFDVESIIVQSECYSTWSFGLCSVCTVCSKHLFHYDTLYA